MATERRVDASSLVALRVGVGLLAFASAVRFLVRGWVEALLLAPGFHFHYYGFGWVDEPSPALAYGLLVVLALACLTLAAGVRVRLSAALAFVCFTWVELVDLSYYLNHYYFLSCLLALFVVLPPAPEVDGRVRAWQLTLTRVQIGMVYVYAGLAKLEPDWLVHAQPLKIWLARHAHLPLIGPYMDEAWLAHAASWAGASFDLLVVPALLWPRTRAWAYAAVLVFHVSTGLLFPIGMFPWIMIVCATILLAPEWPRAYLPTWLLRPAPARARAAMGLAGALVAVQLILPWRSVLYPGSVLWHEQGFRFSYRVMLMEKTGFVSFQVHDRQSGRRWQVDPRDELTAFQLRMMSTQPDMIAAYARHIADEIARERPGSEITVTVEALCSLNGRAHQRLIDPEVDLAAVQPSLAPQPWILPAPTTEPP
jgi:hypothetical protein